MRNLKLPVVCLAAAVACAHFTASFAAADVDLSSPKSAFKAYTTALAQNDRATLVQTVIASAKGQQMLDGQLAYNEIEKNFRAATVKAFPESAKELPDPFTDLIASITAADVQTDGDSAILTTKQTMQPVKLKKQDGNWKVDVSSMFADNVADEVIQFRKALSDVMQGMTEEVQHGKFNDYNDVRSNLEQRVKMRLAMPPAEEPTTTTKP